MRMIMLGYDTITMISVDIQCISWTLHNAGFVDNGFYDTVANEIDEVDYYAPMIFFLTAHCTDNSVTTFIQ